MSTGPEPEPEPIPPLPTPGRHDPYAALRIPGYRRLALAAVASSFGGEIQAVAVGWELYERTHSAAVLGFIGLAQVIPVYFLTLPAGHAADKFDRRTIFAVAQAMLIASAVGLFAFSRLGAPVWVAYALLVLTGSAQALLRPARWSLVAHLVPREVLQNAVTWNSTTWQLASIAGPVLAGRLIDFSGSPAWAYAATAGLSTISILAISGIRARVSPAEDAGPTTLNSFLAGFKFVWANDLILATITLDLFAVLLGGAQALLPMFADDILHVGPSGLGWLRSAESIGAVVMAVVIAHRRPLQRSGLALIVAVIGFGVAMIGFGLSRDLRLSFACLAIAGAFDQISIVVRSTLLQVLTPDSMRGRVSAVNSLFVGTSNELGGFESGLAAYAFGPVASVVGGGVGTIVVVALVLAVWPKLLKLGPLQKPT